MNKSDEKQFKELVDSAVKVTQRITDGLEPLKNNPSVRDSYHEAKGRLEGLKSVQEALAGNKFNLRMLGLTI